MRLGAQGKAEQRLGGAEQLGGAERRLGGAEQRLGGVGEVAELCGAAELLGVPLTVSLKAANGIFGKECSGEAAYVNETRFDQIKNQTKIQ